jgi:hypothetical protein
MMGGWGFWGPHPCEEPKCDRVGDHTHDGHFYCKLHYKILAQGYSLCPGCDGDGIYIDNGKIHPKRLKCPLCKGDGALAP